MLKFACLLIAVGLSTPSSHVIAQSGADRPSGAIIVPAAPAAESDEQGSARQRIGLALSGGGARGSAHVGVLRALEQFEVPIDYIAGTSMGAIVGALYSAGYSPDEIERIILNTDWIEAFADSADRPDQTMRKKQLEANFLIPHRVGFNSGEMQFPRGLIEGQHLHQIFNRLFLPVRDVSQFDELRIPFRAVATDLATGSEVVLSRGSLPTAVRASMSLPGIFAPVSHRDRLLVDGGMANNLPISVVREMGADIVIAVDISTPLLTLEQLTSVLSVTEQITNFLTRRNTEQQLAMLGPGDILIVPDLQGITSADFTRAPETIQRGYDATKLREAPLTALALMAQSPLDRVAGRSPGGDEEYIVHFIDIRNRSVLNDQIIASRLDAPIGEPLDFEQLERNIGHIHSLDVFQTVTYELDTNEAGETGLILRATPRSWGPNYLQFGLEFSDDFSGNSDYTIGAAYTRNALNSLGGDLRVDVSVGREDRLAFDFYQPVDQRAHWFVEAQTYGKREQFNYFENSVDVESAVAQFELSYAGVRLGIGRNFGSTDTVRLNYNWAHGDADVLIGDLPVIDDTIRVGELELGYLHDSLDSLGFPTDGNLFHASYRFAREYLDAGSDFEQALLLGSVARTFGKNSLLFHLEGGYSLQDDIPVERWFELGGFGRLSGFVPGQFIGPYVGFASLFAYRQLNDIEVFPAYAGVTLEAGNVWSTEDEVAFDNLLYSSSLFIGADTPIGPVYLAVGFSDQGDAAIYFYLGNPWLRSRF